MINALAIGHEFKDASRESNLGDQQCPRPDQALPLADLR
jgi:hypothetical protein